jgi:hypothetical protein
MISTAELKFINMEVWPLIVVTLVVKLSPLPHVLLQKTQVLLIVGRYLAGQVLTQVLLKIYLPLVQLVQLVGVLTQVEH